MKYQHINKVSPLLWLLLGLFVGGLPLSAKQLVVEPGGALPGLTEALALAGDGDKIVVKPGTYREATIVIDKSVEIAGEGFPVFDGQEAHQVFTVTANDVIIRGLEVRNCGVSFIEDRAGIKVEEAFRVTIENNRFVNNFFAIYLAKSADCRVANNEIVGFAKTETASGNGIHLWYCRNITIDNNRVTGHRDGIYFEFVKDGRVRGNHSESNLRYGLHFMFSDGCHYLGNTFVRNGAGVAVMYTKNVEMHDNFFDNNWGSASFGLLLKDITDSRISGNRFRKNSVGIYLENSSRVRVADNDFLENGWAVKIMANCMDDEFRGNNFIGNAFDVATNSRNNFSKFEGNFWNHYKGYDLNQDGYGDVPFRPVRLFSMIVQRYPESLILLRSLFIDLLNVAEDVFPVLTPETLIDPKPLMRQIPRGT